MQKPAASALRWYRDGNTFALHLWAGRDWAGLLGVVLFIAIVSCTSNPWSQLFSRLLVGPGFGLNAIGLIRVVFWGLTGLFLVRLALQLVSREMLTIGRGVVTIRRQWLQWPFYYRRFEVRAIRQLVVREPHSNAAKQQSSLFTFANGTLQFHLATETVAFGLGLTPAEARLALEELARLGALPAALVAPALATTQLPILPT